MNNNLRVTSVIVFLSRILKREFAGYFIEEFFSNFLVIFHKAEKKPLKYNHFCAAWMLHPIYLENH